MHFFKPSEFPAGEFVLLDKRVHPCLDDFRKLWGGPVFITPVRGGVARRGGNSRSQHNVTRWGKSRAVDVFPKDMGSAVARARAVDCAVAAGFTGIGLYPDWRDGRGNRGGLHLDIRPGAIALWSGWARSSGQTYEAIGAALPRGWRLPER